MVQFLTYIVLIFTLLIKTVFPFGAIQRTTAADTGSLAATDALGRQTVSAGESKKKVGIFYFLCNGEHSQDGDIFSFYTRGDAAPYGRLNWVYTSVYALPKLPVRLFFNP